ncbi:MAG: hypothetical protein HC859_11085, partial [Bacteroidia bacterium]|nr:hypothetical protein [Bacteroidia bacterium]
EQLMECVAAAYRAVPQVEDKALHEAQVLVGQFVSEMKKIDESLKVVTVFLDALKNGDTSTKASLLTSKALAETTKHEFEVNPQSAPNAQYEVHPPEFLQNNPNGAHVTSVWTETYEDGQVTYEVVWVLRRETQGWRIAGMAIELIPGQPPSFLNFEDPADMAAKYNEAIAAQEQPAAETAAKPESPSAIQATPIER